MSTVPGTKMPYQIAYDTFYGIIDTDSADVVDANGAPIGEYSYRAKTLSVGELDRIKECSELIVERLDVNQVKLYPGHRLDEAKTALETLRQRDDGGDYQLIKLTHKTYHYITIEELAP